MIAIIITVDIIARKLSYFGHVTIIDTTALRKPSFRVWWKGSVEEEDLQQVGLTTSRSCLA